MLKSLCALQLEAARLSYSRRRVPRQDRTKPYWHCKTSCPQGSSVARFILPCNALKHPLKCCDATAKRQHLTCQTWFGRMPLCFGFPDSSR